MLSKRQLRAANPRENFNQERPATFAGSERMESGLETQEQRDNFVRVVTRRMVDGSESAFGEFYSFVFDRLFRMLLIQTRGDEDLSKDLVQSVMLRAAKYVQAFENERVLWSWLRQIARSCHVDWLRRKGREPQFVSLELFTGAEMPGSQAEDEELFNALDASMKQLDSDEREVLRLAYYEGVPQQSMAKTLSTTAKAIESKLRRIRQKLRRALLERLKDYALL
jgi:RNA polymerase sigma-70 factor, ECF subfamily